MFQSNKNVAKGVVAQLFLEEQEYRSKLYNSDEYTKFNVEDDTTAKLDKLAVEVKEAEIKREKLQKELTKLDERKKEISSETLKLLRTDADTDHYYYWSEMLPEVAKQHYTQKARNVKYETHAWYPEQHTLKAIVLGQIESGNFSSFDEIVQAMRTKYQK